MIYQRKLQHMLSIYQNVTLEYEFLHSKMYQRKLQLTSDISNQIISPRGTTFCIVRYIYCFNGEGHILAARCHDITLLKIPFRIG